MFSFFIILVPSKFLSSKFWEILCSGISSILDNNGFPLLVLSILLLLSLPESKGLKLFNLL